MKLACSIVQYNFTKHPFERALDDMVEARYEGVETHVPPDVLAKGSGKVKRLLDAVGLTPVKLALIGYGIDSGVGSLAESSAQALDRTLS